MRSKIIIFAGLIMLMAQQGNSANLYIGPQIGYYVARNADNGSFIGGANCRLKLIPMLGAEASISYRQEAYLNDAVTIRSWPVMVTGMFYPIPVVYGAIGAGWYNSTFDYNQNKLPLLSDETIQRFGWHFGAGVELPATSNIKIIGDIRYVFLNYDFTRIPGAGDLKSDFLVIMVGVLFGI